MKKKITILGSTGSIGTQALEVVEKLGFEVVGITANSSIDTIKKQIEKFDPLYVGISNIEKANELEKQLGDKYRAKIFKGDSCNNIIAGMKEADIVLNSLVGIAGLRPTVTAIEAGKDIALANKETLVTGGQLVTNLAKKNGVTIYPVDSEHSAIFQCMQGKPDGTEVSKVILTASGGPFFGKTLDELKNVTPKDALNHPNWSMGNKITIDSATMMNKGLEFIEAVWLFNMDPSNIDIIVHRESVIHSLIQYPDHSVIAQLGVPDMKIPIQYALTYPQRVDCDVKELDLAEFATLTFYKPDYKTFKCMQICIDAIKQGGIKPAVANGANEIAVALFLEGKIKFTDIGDLVEKAVTSVPNIKDYTLQDVFDADKTAREIVLSLIN